MFILLNVDDDDDDEAVDDNRYDIYWRIARTWPK